MFLGNVIRDHRKQLHLNQQQLATGICTQTVISRMENQNISPSVDVLIQICRRLDLTLNDVYSEFQALPSSNLLNDKLIQITNLVQQNEFNQANELLLSLKTNDLSSYQQAQLAFLRGRIALSTKEGDLAVFQFNSILTMAPNQHNALWNFLANVELGQIYQEKQQIEIAQHYFEVATGINVSPSTLTETLYYRESLLRLSKYFSERKEFGQSNKLINLVLNNNRDALVVAQYTDEFYYLAAANTLLDTSSNRNQASHFLISAIAFAEYNQNDTLMQKITELMHQNQITELKIKS